MVTNLIQMILTYFILENLLVYIPRGVLMILNFTCVLGRLGNYSMFLHKITVLAVWGVPECCTQSIMIRHQALFFPLAFFFYLVPFLCKNVMAIHQVWQPLIFFRKYHYKSSLQPISRNFVLFSFKWLKGISWDWQQAHVCLLY